MCSESLGAMPRLGFISHEACGGELQGEVVVTEPQQSSLLSLHGCAEHIVVFDYSLLFETSLPLVSKTPDRFSIGVWVVHEAVTSA